MGRDLSRRSFLLAAAVVSLSGCQIAEERLDLHVDGNAEQAFFDAIRTFAREQGYRIIDDEFTAPGYSNIFLRGFRSLVWIDGSPGCGFEVHFRSTGDFWSFVLPGQDLAQLKHAFERAVLDVQGLEVADVSASRRACRVR